MRSAHEAAARAVITAIEAYADNPSAFLALNEGNEYFAAPGGDGVIAYRPAGRYWLQFGGPFAPEEEIPGLVHAFLAAARKNRRRVAAVQLQRPDAERYTALGFTVNQLGASYAVDLQRFTTRGNAFMRLRNKVSRARRSGLSVAEAEVRPELEHELGELDREWLRSKGRHTRPLRFLVGDGIGHLREHRRVFVGRIGGAAACYIVYSPAYGSRPGWLHDLSRRRVSAPPGVLEAVNMAAIECFQAERAPWLHFGFTPFTGLRPDWEVTSSSPLMARAARLLASHGSAVYPARTQLAYKEKWAPHLVLPEYLAFHGRPRFGAVWSLLRAANAL